MGVETIKWQTRAVHVAIWLQARVCRLSLQPIGCMSALSCDAKCCCSCSARLVALCKFWAFTIFLLY